MTHFSQNQLCLCDINWTDKAFVYIGSSIQLCGHLDWYTNLTPLKLLKSVENCIKNLWSPCCFLIFTCGVPNNAVQKHKRSPNSRFPWLWRHNLLSIDQWCLHTYYWRTNKIKCPTITLKFDFWYHEYAFKLAYFWKLLRIVGITTLKNGYPFRTWNAIN
jgi:hypothetical protein